MQSKKTKNIIFFTPKTQYVNLGDLVIIKVLLDNLRQYGSIIVDDEGVPEWFLQELEIKNDERASIYGIKFFFLILKFALEALLKSNNRCYYVLAPGHHFSKSISNTNYLKYLIKKTNYLIRKMKAITTLALFKIFEIRICRFGCSIGPFSKTDELVEALQAKLMYFYSTRDSKSAAYAKKIGANKVEFFPDLAWLLKPSASDELVKSKDEYVIFSFRESTNSLDDPTAYCKYLLPVLDEVVEIVCKKWQKKLLVAYQVDFDYEFCKDISNRYKEECDVIFVEEKINCKNMYDLYSQAYMVFSNRLHVLIFAIMYGSIPVTVVNKLKHDKIIGIFSDVGLMRLVIDISSEAHGLELLNEIDADTDALKKELALCVEHNQKSGDATLRYVMTGERQ